MDVHLTKHLNVSKWCDCNVKSLDQCECYTEWKKKVLFKQHIHDWPCGLHADWTYLHECVRDKQKHAKMKQRHLYLTMIRDPVNRYISEWQHVARGAIWRKLGEPMICNGKSASEDIPMCFTKPNWRNVTLGEFMRCSSNMAVNRQTRMLADLSLVNCYNTSGTSFEERHGRMLESAKDNLRNMAFFGVTDYQVLTQLLFEYTFNLTFTINFSDIPDIRTFSGKTHLEKAFLNNIAELNKYDVLLYQYGKNLFLQRLWAVAQNTNNSTVRYNINSRLKQLI